VRTFGVAALAAVLAAALLASPSAHAHSGSATFGEVAAEARGVTWTLRVRVADLIGPEMGVGLTPGAGVPDALARGGAVEERLARGLHVASGGADCPIVERSLAADGAATLAARFRFACAGTAFALRYDLFFDVDPLHSGYTKLGDGTTHVFRAADRALALGAARSIWGSAREYLLLGVEHIFTGYDHLAFLAALLLATGLAHRSSREGSAIPNLPRRALRDVLQIVTAFTAAHSLTLIASTLRPGLLGTAWVEPGIALSIAYVGFENLRARPPARRWLIVFAFGLVHGLGFSSVLREIGLPAQGLVLSLLAFNLGVELGQLAVVSVVLPLVLVAARRRPAAFERWGLRGGSLAIALAGVVWFVLRVR
jgi:hypothetical protein